MPPLQNPVFQPKNRSKLYLATETLLTCPVVLISILLLLSMLQMNLYGKLVEM